MEDIRIGNDVCFKINLSEVDEIVVNNNIEKIIVDLIHTNQFYTPSEYTLHACGEPRYNVLPINDKAQYDSAVPFVDYSSIRLTEITEPSQNGNFKAYFKAKELRSCGTYRVVCHIITDESDWDGGSHTYTKDFGNVFNLVSCTHGTCGSIIIELPSAAEENDPSESPDVPTTPVVKEQVYFGSFAGNASAFKTATDTQLLTGVTKISFSGTDTGKYTQNKSWVYMLVPSNVEINKFGYTDPYLGFMDLTSRLQLLSAEHESITYSEKEYTVYAYFDYSVSSESTRDWDYKFTVKETES